MKKKIVCLLAAACLFVSGFSQPVYAEEHKGSTSWVVTFDGKKMQSNFKSSEMAEEVYQIQPGDTIELQVKLKNTGNYEADWYMTNEVLQSLEDSQEAAGGGAYTYILTYVDNKKKKTVLYNSESVGGEGEAGGEEGLYQATGTLSDYFFLDSLKKGQSGTVHLTVGLDGETQGNGYQDTLAQLQMNFAVDEGAAVVSAKKTEAHKQVGDPLVSSTARNLPKTGDETSLAPYCAAALLSGMILLVAGLLLLKRNREDDGMEVEA